MGAAPQSLKPTNTLGVGAKDVGGGGGEGRGGGGGEAGVTGVQLMAGHMLQA